MKKSLVILAVLVLGLVFSQNVFAQTADQTVTFAVNAVAKLAVSGDPGALTITDGTAGATALTSVSNAGTTYSLTHNSNSALKITAELDADMPASTTLNLALASGNGTPGNSNLTTTAADIVTNIARGADATQTITYTFGADASAGVIASTTRTVTLTLTN